MLLLLLAATVEAMSRSRRGSSWTRGSRRHRTNDDSDLNPAAGNIVPQFFGQKRAPVDWPMTMSKSRSSELAKMPDGDRFVTLVNMLDRPDSMGLAKSEARALLFLYALNRLPD